VLKAVEIVGAQREGLDYVETFASTARAASVRMFMSVALERKLKLALGDAIKAFTQAEVDCLMFSDMPRGFEEDGFCLQLLMMLEGGKQGAHLWQELFSDVLTNKMKSFKFT
jgi:hypothetical protein